MGFKTTSLENIFFQNYPVSFVNSKNSPGVTTSSLIIVASWKEETQGAVSPLLSASHPLWRFVTALKWRFLITPRCLHFVLLVLRWVQRQAVKWKESWLGGERPGPPSPRDHKHAILQLCVCKWKHCNVISKRPIHPSDCPCLRTWLCICNYFYPVFLGVCSGEGSLVCFVAMLKTHIWSLTDSHSCIHSLTHLRLFIGQLLCATIS